MHVTMGGVVTPSPVGPTPRSLASHVAVGLAGKVLTATRKVSNEYVLIPYPQCSFLNELALEL